MRFRNPPSTCCGCGTRARIGSTTYPRPHDFVRKLHTYVLELAKQYSQDLINAQRDKKRHIVPNINRISATAIQAFSLNIHHLQ